MSLWGKVKQWASDTYVEPIRRIRRYKGRFFSRGNPLWSYLGVLAASAGAVAAAILLPPVGIATAIAAPVGVASYTGGAMLSRRLGASAFSAQDPNRHRRSSGSGSHSLGSALQSARVSNPRPSLDQKRRSRGLSWKRASKPKTKKLSPLRPDKYRDKPIKSIVGPDLDVFSLFLLVDPAARRDDIFPVMKSLLPRLKSQAAAFREQGARYRLAVDPNLMTSAQYEQFQALMKEAGLEYYDVRQLPSYQRFHQFDYGAQQNANVIDTMKVQLCELAKTGIDGKSPSDVLVTDFDFNYYPEEGGEPTALPQLAVTPGSLTAFTSAARHDQNDVKMGTENSMLYVSKEAAAKPQFFEKAYESIEKESCEYRALATFTQMHYWDPRLFRPSDVVIANWTVGADEHDILKMTWRPQVLGQLIGEYKDKAEGYIVQKEKKGELHNELVDNPTSIIAILTYWSQKKQCESTEKFMRTNWSHEKKITLIKTMYPEIDPDIMLASWESFDNKDDPNAVQQWMDQHLDPAQLLVEDAEAERILSIYQRLNEALKSDEVIPDLMERIHRGEINGLTEYLQDKLAVPEGYRYTQSEPFLDRYTSSSQSWEGGSWRLENSQYLRKFGVGVLHGNYDSHRMKTWTETGAERYASFDEAATQLGARSTSSRPSSPD